MKSLGESATHSVKVLDSVASRFVLPKVVLVLVGIKLGSVIVARLLLELENIDIVDIVRDDVELGARVLHLFGDFGSGDHCEGSDGWFRCM